MNCGHSLFEEENSKSSILRMISGVLFFLLNLALLGLPIFRRKKSQNKQKRKCDYCDSDFIFPDTLENRQLLKSTKH